MWNYHTVSLISQTRKVMLKILQAKLQHYVNWELPDVQAGFRKDRGTRDQIANIHWITEKYLLLLHWLHKDFSLYGSQQTVETSSRDGNECQITFPVSWETCMQVKKQQLEPDMEQWTGFKLGKEQLNWTELCAFAIRATYL